MINPNNFKIRCSAIGDLMAGSVGLTERQAATYVELAERKRKGYKPLTPKMEQEFAELNERLKNPELPQTLQSFCLTWITEQLYERRKDFSSKYTEKGIMQEQSAIEFCSDLLGWGMVAKNEERRENEFMTGEPDIILAESIEDIKCSWDCFSFPLFESDLNPRYFWQAQGYMHLFGKKKAGINYCLMDAPEMLIEFEARNEARKRGEDEVTVELYQEVCDRMTYSHLPASIRHKRFEVEYDPFAIESVIDRVKMCRKFIAQVVTTIPRRVELAAH